ncbi:hypothetical protein NDU88_002062 [Pleurodeles waltl]|uniref:Uncharacterized protein n=1 Tax=Pleurodeles waltl TaxID=8319 RepID=A0AAV7LHS5_PLEWA|nr:hypothetical protein NDU88_002062 [Pleurodeles waltl]
MLDSDSGRVASSAQAGRTASGCPTKRRRREVGRFGRRTARLRTSRSSRFTPLLSRCCSRHNVPVPGGELWSGSAGAQKETGAGGSSAGLPSDGEEALRDAVELRRSGAGCAAPLIGEGGT